MTRPPLPRVRRPGSRDAELLSLGRRATERRPERWLGRSFGRRATEGGPERRLVRRFGRRATERRPERRLGRRFRRRATERRDQGLEAPCGPISWARREP